MAELHTITLELAERDRALIEDCTYWRKAAVALDAALIAVLVCTLAIAWWFA